VRTIERNRMLLALTLAALGALAVSGPALPDATGDSVWGSAAGLLFSWAPFDFGYRRATVDTARREADRAADEARLTRLDVAMRAADGFLAVAAAEQTLRAARADLDRRRALAELVHAQVASELRPGADASRADAEEAAARIAVIEAEANATASRALLGAIVGLAPGAVVIDATALLDLPPGSPPPAPPIASHPSVEAEKAAIDVSKARQLALDREYSPRFTVQSSIFGRGSGARTDGTIEGSWSGLGLDRANWAAGLTITFPLFDVAGVRAERQREAATERAAEARYDQRVADLTAEIERARALADGARQVAAITPIELAAARDGER